MTLRPDVLAVVAVMAVITYALRAGGLLVGGRLPTTGAWGRALTALPGVVLVSIVVPAMLAEGPVGVVAGGLAVAAMVRTRNLVVAMAVGIMAVALARLLGA